MSYNKILNIHSNIYDEILNLKEAYDNATEQELNMIPEIDKQTFEIYNEILRAINKDYLSVDNDMLEDSINTLGLYRLEDLLINLTTTNSYINKLI